MTHTTDLDLAPIEARHAAATKGPWGVYQYGGDSLIEIAADLQETGTGYRARRDVCRLDEEPMDNDPTHREWTAEEDWAQVQADSAFIAHAPADVDALLAEVHRLRAELATARAAALTEGAAAIDHLRATMLAPPVADLYATGLSGAAGELRRLAALTAEETHGVADGNGWPGDEHAEPGTRGWTA